MTDDMDKLLHELIELQLKALLEKYSICSNDLFSIKPLGCPNLVEAYKNECERKEQILEDELFEI